MNIPYFIYGTAWKEEKTTDLVTTAIHSGFKAIDTANQAKHYSEPLVGEALKKLAAEGFKREELWLQSKFTSVGGQDDRLPYDPNESLTTQVKQSFASSLEHLHTDYLDSYLLHGPYNYPSLGDEDFEVWQAIEDLYNLGSAKAIGISNVNYGQLETLIQESKIKPMMVQNRCYAQTNWDKKVRELCKTHNIHYQGFSLLTANPHIVNSEFVAKLAEKYQVIPAQIIFRFSSQIGMIPLTGTSNQQHMQLDLDINGFQLSDEEMEMIEYY